MFLGRVVGTVWSTVKWPELAGLKLLLVRPYHLAELMPGDGSAAPAAPPGGPADLPEAVVCADLMDAGVGDQVVIAYGHAARVAAWEALHGASSGSGGAPLAAPPIPIDAAIVAVVDGYHIERDSAAADHEPPRP